MATLQFKSQTNPEIKMSQPTLNIQKLNTYKKYSTSFHQPGNTSVDTREIEKLFQAVTLNGHTTVRKPHQSEN